MSGAAVTLAGEEVILLPERAAHWPAARTLFVADLHVGKAASLRAAGAPLPGGSTTTDLDRLSRLIAETGASRVIVLGDWYHARSGRVAAATRLAMARWRERHPELELQLVRGNHDRHAGDPDAGLRVTVLEAGARAGPFSLWHDPAGAAPAGGFALAGHLHPAVALRGPGGERRRLPCFWIRTAGMVLPAFGSTTGSVAVRASGIDRLFAIVEGEVLEV